MATGLPPPPINDAPGSFTWLEWYRQLRSYISTSGSVPWYVIDFAGSNITDIAQRDHNQLQNLQGGTAGEMYHLTAAQYATIGSGDHNDLSNIQGGTATQRYHLNETQYNWVAGGGGGGGSYLPLTGGTMTGPINWLVNTGTGSINVVPDVDYGGNMLEAYSADGITVRAPYVLLDTPNAILSIPGAQAGSAIIVAGIDGAGNAQLGYGAAQTPGYSVSDTHDANVVIKAAGVAPPTAWVPLGLTVTLTQDTAANTATLSFEIELQNPTTRTGVVEFGLRVNGTDLFRDVVQQIPANYLSTVIMSIPLINAYNSGDVITLIARVTSNSNNGFSLTMLASPTNPAVMRFQTLGSTGIPEAPVDGQQYGRQNAAWTVVTGTNPHGTYTGIVENDITLTTDYTITTNKNGMSAGPITVANGVTITVPTGSTWSVV